jgi:hypothetical protein
VLRVTSQSQDSESVVTTCSAWPGAWPQRDLKTPVTGMQLIFHDAAAKMCLVGCHGLHRGRRRGDRRHPAVTVAMTVTGLSYQ